MMAAFVEKKRKATVLVSLRPPICPVFVTLMQAYALSDSLGSSTRGERGQRTFWPPPRPPQFQSGYASASVF